jgi:hypothetical protein
VINPGQDSIFLVIHPLLDLIPEGMETIILTLNQISCSGSVTADTIRIYDYIPMSIIKENDTTLCHGGSIHLQATASDGLRPFTFTWNVPASDSVLNTVPPVGINTYIVNVKDLCNNQVADTVVVTVHPKPTADAGTDVSIPNGTSTTLHGTAGGGYGTYSYDWTSNPPGFTSTLQNPSMGNLTLTTIYNLQTTDALSSCKSDPDNVIVAVSGGPLTTNPVADPDTICYGDVTHIYSLAGGGSGLYIYSWTSNPPGFTSDQQDFLVTPLENTTYQVTVNDGFNQLSGSSSVFVNPLPVINLGPPDSTVCIYSTVTLDGGNPGSTYLWSNGAVSRSITVGASGIGFEIQPYKVIVTNQNACIDSASINVIFSFSACVGIEEQTSRGEFMVYPNPNEGKFRLTLKSISTRLSVELLNLFGKKVYSEEWKDIPGGIAEKEFNVSFLPAGMYILQLKGDNFFGERKLVIR